MARPIGLSVLFAAALITAGWSLYSWVAGRPPAPVTGNDVTYICLETREVIDGPVQPVPALNPTTGRRTLIRAIYSNSTKEWVPAPSEELLRMNRRALAQDDGSSPLAFEPPADNDDSEEPE
jgi:hypothetical protein